MTVEFQCGITVTGEYLRFDVTDTMSNYEMWIAGTMLAAVCARNGKGGIHESMGKCS